MWMDKLVLSVYNFLATIGSRESNPVDQGGSVTTPRNWESDQRCTIQLLPKSIAIVIFRVLVGALIVIVAVRQ